jgi:hypothetical protein
MKSEDRLQLSLFTRLNAVEAELRTMKDLLAELKVNQDGLRRDRDEWRWRAERLLADRERGALGRWRVRADAALDIVGASLSRLTIDLRARLAEIRVRRDGLRQRADGLVKPGDSSWLDAKWSDGSAVFGKPRSLPIALAHFWSAASSSTRRIITWL